MENAKWWGDGPSTRKPRQRLSTANQRRRAEPYRPLGTNGSLLNVSSWFQRLSTDR